MAILRNKEIGKMNVEERRAKMDELRFSLIKAGVTANRQTAKTKEIKRTIARLMTHEKFSKPQKNDSLKKK